MPWFHLPPIPQRMCLFEKQPSFVCGGFGPLLDSPKVHFHTSLLWEELFWKSLRRSLIKANCISMWVYMTWSERFSLLHIIWEKPNSQRFQEDGRVCSQETLLLTCIDQCSFSPQFSWMSSCVPSWWAGHWPSAELAGSLWATQQVCVQHFFFLFVNSVHLCLCLSFSFSIFFFFVMLIFDSSC